MRRVLSWMFVRGPAAFYEFAEANQGSSRGDAKFLRIAAGSLGGLGLISGVGWVVGRRRKLSQVTRLD
ncbi:hypothetical protein ACFVWG_27015 [Kribbella sp. NPDC058245]|uniref:hypothetical protein n=1 Tax=Kribbella sp. NPDC058245 TaxID=3346399 RepID=UPI0036E5A56C